jgi:hypothetical protein
MKKALAPSILLLVVLLAVAVIAEAQQPTTIHRIGYLTGTALSANSVRIGAFRQGVCASLATWRGKTLS